ncbi:hypothetical protein V8C43DRAFT_267914 [Trichoderma afarasin]
MHSCPLLFFLLFLSFPSFSRSAGLRPVVTVLAGGGRKSQKMRWSREFECEYCCVVQVQRGDEMRKVHKTR